MAAAEATLTEVLTDDVYERFEATNRRLLDGCQAIIDAHNLPAYTEGLGAKGCVIFSPERMYEYRDYLTKVNNEFALAWLYHMNHGVFMTPGTEEEWTLSIAHSDEDLQRYLDAFEAFAADLTRSLAAARERRLLYAGGCRVSQPPCEEDRTSPVVAQEEEKRAVGLEGDRIARRSGCRLEVHADDRSCRSDSACLVDGQIGGVLDELDLQVGCRRDAGEVRASAEGRRHAQLLQGRGQLGLGALDGSAAN